MNFKRFLYCFLYASFTVFSQNQQAPINPDGYNKFYFENGTISSEGPMKQGKPEGYWKTYFMNGRIKSEGNRVNFLLDSIWKFYTEDGKLAMEFNYKDGKKNGLKKVYDAKDTFLVSQENFINDVKKNNTTYFYPNGKVMQTVPFIAGKEEGVGYNYDEDGIIVTITEYKMGFVKKQERINRKDRKGFKQGMWKEFYENKVMKNECNYTDDKRNGYYKEYSMDGSLLNTVKYINGKVQQNVPELAKIEVRNQYYDGGKIKYSGGYKDGVPEGIHREYDTTGKITNSLIFKDGELTAEGILDALGHEQGFWKEFHPNGELKSEGEYKDGKRIGDWKFYHSNKKTEQIGKYDKKGNAQGVWKWYYESGNLLREENYANNLREGLMTEYGDTGAVITKGEFVEGQKEGKWIYELGDYREEGNYKEDKRDGEWKHYYSDSGKLRFEGKFVDGNPDGWHKYYYSNGKLRQEENYEVGQKEGEWKYYSDDGFLYLTITYKNDVEIKFDGVKVVPTEEEVDQKN